MATYAPTERRILRYTKPERLVHWIGASAVLLLLVTGLFLIWAPLAPLAAGGYSRLLHRAGALLFLAAPVLYAVLNRAHLRRLLTEPFRYDRDDLRWLLKAPRYFLGHAKEMPPQGRINAGQKLHHAGTFIAFVAVTLSGFALWFGKAALGAEGMAVAAIIHNLSMLAITVLMIGHVYFTLVYGALPAMTTGYVSAEYARLEHAKWLAELETAAAEPVQSESSADCADCADDTAVESGSSDTDHKL
jgi:formate dehydrogenase subunit gamma